jgi:hypothetical protein
MSSLKEIIQSLVKRYDVIESGMSRIKGENCIVSPNYFPTNKPNRFLYERGFTHWDIHWNEVDKSVRVNLYRMVYPGPFLIPDDKEVDETIIVKLKT